MAINLPASFQQLKDVPLKVDVAPLLRDEIQTLLARASTEDGQESARRYFADSDALVQKLLAVLDEEMARLTQLRFQFGDANALRQKLVAEPKRQVDQLLSGLKQRVSNDKSDWSRRLGKQSKDVQDQLAQELLNLPAAGELIDGTVVVRPNATWKLQFQRWCDSTVAKWASHLGNLLHDKTLTLLRSDLDQLGQLLDAKLEPSLPLASVPVISPQIADRNWESRFEAPGLAGTIFETFKSGLNTVAMLAGMIVIPVVGSLMNESPVHIRAMVMGGTILPVILFAGFQGVRARTRIHAQLNDKARQEISKNVEAAVKSQFDRFRVDAERYCADYGQQALAAIIGQVEPFVNEHFAGRELSAVEELAKMQIQLDRLQDQLMSLRNVRGNIANQVQVDIRRRLSDG